MRHSQLPAAARFEWVIDTDPYSVSQTRKDLGHWLQCQCDLDSVRQNDVVLAVYEALANAAEYAYLSADTPGPITLTAEHDPAHLALTLIVADRGRWRENTPAQRMRTGGRGIPLIQLLADSASIDTSKRGTTVRMVFEDVSNPSKRNGAKVTSH